MLTKNTNGTVLCALLAGSVAVFPATIALAATGSDMLAAPAVVAEQPDSFQIAQISVGDAVNAVTEEANKAAEAADAAVAEATETTEAAESEATDAAEAETSETEAAETESTEAAETEATEAAETETTETTETEESTEAEASDADALTTEGFDLSTANSLIDGSSLSETEKMALKTALEQAQSNPALLDAALQQARGALGM